MKGVALKIQNGVASSAADIINTHFKKERHSGKVYFSTNVPFDKKRKLEVILFFFSHKGSIRYVLADVIQCEFNTISFIPSDSSNYSPEEYATVEKKSWFLINQMREVDIAFVKECTVEYNTGNAKKLIDIIESENRINRVYFNRPSENNEDILIR